MSLRIARFLYRFRLPLTGLILLGAIVLAPRANITDIDNDLTAWFSREDPVYQEYERFRDEFGGTRNLIVALETPSRERLLSAGGLRVHPARAAPRSSASRRSIASTASRPRRSSTALTTSFGVRRLFKDLETQIGGRGRAAGPR